MCSDRLSTQLCAVLRAGSLILACVLCGMAVSADITPPGADNVPSALVTANTKQVYRFHFSGLPATDVTRLAEQLWPVVSKLPADNPLHRMFLDAKDRAGFSDDYRSLRNIFLEAGIDTVYFLADEYWIESRMLPGTVVIAGDLAVRDRMQQRLKRAGHADWAATIAQLQPSPSAPGWMTFGVGAATGGQVSAAKKKIVEHALKECCPIRPASFHVGSLPALRMALNDSTPLAVVNLERNKLDAVLTQILTALVPSSAQTAKLSEKVVATTVTSSVYPFPHVRQVAHCSSAGEATALAAEVNKQVNGAVQKIVDLDAEIGPLLGLFAQSTIIVSARGNDVHMIMKPPALFDLDLAAIKATSAMDLDWTALPAPAGYHWELIGSVGQSSRNDVFARVYNVRVRGTSGVIAPDDKTAEPATFRVPDSGMILARDLKGNLAVDLAKQGAKKGPFPAVELLDDRNRVVAVLRLDLGPGDPRFDLARTRSVLAKRIADQTNAERVAKKEVDDVENAHQRAKLDSSARTSRQSLEEWNERLREKYRAHGMAQAARQVWQELDKQARESQRNHPGVTLVKDGSAPGSEATWSIDRNKFPFAGQWVFDYGVLTLHQDASGNVAGVFATKAFYNSLKHEIDQGKGTVGSAILSGRAKGSKLDFAMFDFRGQERTGQLVLGSDGAKGTWKLQSTTTETIRSSKTNRIIKGSPRRKEQDAEDDRTGALDRIEVAAPEALCVQQVPTASFAGYWVHPTDKRMNILFRSRENGLLEGAQGNSQTSSGNLRAAAAGNLLVILENVNVGLQSPSVRGATLSAESQKLTFLAPREKSSTSGLVGRNSRPLELTRDRSE